MGLRLPNAFTVAITIAIILSLFSTRADAFASKFPCHANRPAMNRGVTCTHMQLPPGLCTACPLREPDLQGNFKNCADTYDTAAPGCLGKMEQYVAANPCDPIRAKAVADLKANPNDDDARQKVDYFLYAVCEQCCDCVPIGSSPVYDPATAYVADRGNCPAHAHFDICKLSLQVKKITLIGGKPPAATDPKACDLLGSWFKSPESRGWVSNAKTTLVPPLTAFLEGLIDAAQCRNRELWQKCYDLELKQNRLGTPVDAAPAPSVKPVPAKSTVPAPSVIAAKPSIVAAPAATVKPSPDLAPAAVPSAAASTVPSTKADVSIAPGALVSPLAAATAGVSSGPLRGSEPVNLGSESPTPFASVTPEVEGEPPLDRAPEPGSNTTADQPTPTELVAPPIIPLGEGAEPTAPPAGNATCFPADSTVELSTGKSTTMEHLRIGDLVRVNTGVPAVYQPVFMFSHRDTSAVTDHIVVNGRLTLSPGHYVSGRRADQLVRGSVLDTVDGRETVNTIEYVRKTGLFNPHTAAGYVVVDGVLCSTYTDAVEKKLAHAALSPIRSAFKCGLVGERLLGGFLRYGSPVQL